MHQAPGTREAEIAKAILPIHPVRPRLMQRQVGSSEFRLPFSPSRRYARRRPLPVARERDPSGRKRGDVGGMWIPGSGH